MNTSSIQSMSKGSRLLAGGNVRRRRAVALITVLSVLALSMVLLTALLSATRVEYNSTAAQVEGAKARLHADSAVNLAISQIQRVAHQDDKTTGREIWTSQPGMVRQYKEDGTLLRGAKLYSDSKMVATTEAEIAADVPPTDWDKRPAQYVDMNEPVMRPNVDDPGGKPRIFFPILDPRAYSTDAGHSVEGFTYTTYANGLSGQSLNGVVAPTGGDGSTQRLPMPVEWLYMLKDGTLGYIDNTGKFIGAGNVEATRANPIISRIAFWTDDESTKININTAGEGTPWDTPRLFHDRDGDWARYQPMAYEYQRYPGHPATVCMSAVLFPGQNMNPPSSDDTAFQRALTYKEAIYDLMPKLLPGGSKAGSVLVPVDRNFSPTDFKEVQKALGERLFPSVDEFLLRANGQAGKGRDEIDLGIGKMWSGLENHEVIERLRPFLTPRSRAPETNPFGLPKISMWPIHRTTTEQFRSVYDRTIAYSARLAGKDYFFTRQDSTSQTELSGIARNKQLFDYLMALTDQPIPGFGAQSATFARKYGDNRQQILVEMFDYIRSTNLYDDNIAEKNVGLDPSITGLPTSRTNAYTAGMAAKTFTPMRNSTGGSFPGHGQVTPTVLPKGKDEVYRGMGRFLTISEVGLHFIACAQGTTQAGGASAPKIDPKGPAPNGYKPPKWNGGLWGNSSNWYSNFPPLSPTNQDPAKGFYKSRYPASHQLEGQPGDSPNHPGYNPMNWNWTLEKDTPLNNGVKRVQATFLLEWFTPSTGWTLINPNIAIEVDASSLTISGKKMFPVNGGKTLIRPFKHMSSANGVYQRGGTISYRAFLQERKLPAVAKGVNGYTAGSILYADTRIPGNDSTHYDTYASRSDALKGCNQYNLVSDFIDLADGGQIAFSGGNVTVKIMTNDSTPKLLQTFNFRFPPSQFPAPLLAQKNEDTTWGQNADGSWWVRQPVPAPYWWSFHSDGALGRDKDGRITTTAADPATRMGGRFRYIGNEIGNYGDVPFGGTYYRGNLVVPDDTLQSLVLRHGDPRLTMGQYIVPNTEFEQHRLYGKQRMAHNIVLRHWSEGPGLDRGEDKKGWRLVKDAAYAASFLPDHPYSAATGAGLQKYGDFDRGVSNQTDGAYINKPDEGNTYSKYNTNTGEQLVPYFTDPWVAWVGSSTYFSPNRQVASPGMFGSLPTGVHQSGNTGGMKREPWRTLLFRPQSWSTKQGQQFHIGAPKALKGFGNGTAGLPIQGIDPPDHLFMDFFWMPVVEPYVISEPGSTAGKINMNYQMAPFRHIRRATGLAAVMKSEYLTAVAHSDAPVYLTRPPKPPTNQSQTWFWKDDESASGKKYWHRQIDIDATLKIFDERFRSGFAFISPAQICEMYLLPKRMSGSDTLVPNSWPDRISDLLKANNASSILRFWENHAVTADNLKERPYTNMYPRLTTRSNTYQVHMRVQAIKKARSTDPATFVPGSDSVTSEYRGSAVIERYLDLNDPAFDTKKNLDYASGNPLSKQPLDELHRFRVIAQKRFDP
ncbi:MAG: Verru_Chthon cassette protein A [Prosthecobacter sp.]|uniref:Verru_Chthon cassette protein A n=1 Tax=Prosthecobacter sp. TaxID=1965333 RepID=UPI001A05FF11|nr:Verru_Chthon cassette protein A [Prosthecobacter sp.]MBE2284102.1 Verru_Chthon cassette protein A [Prosthecobacter sp.]